MSYRDLIAVYQLGIDQSGNVKSSGSARLDTAAYSRMKYGVRSELKRFARLLASKLESDAPQLFTAPGPPAIATSYKAVAPPATTLARYCLDIINFKRVEHGVQPGEMVHVYRPQDYIQEYAVLPLEERRKIISDQSKNTLRGLDLSNYQILILDDIHVTGTYTAMMRRVLKDYDNILCAYLISCDESAQRLPQAEGELNVSDIRKPADLLPYIQADDFVFSRRFLKMLLRTPSDELQPVIDSIPDTLLEQVVRGVVDTDQALPDLFPDACRAIFDAAGKRKVL